MQLPRSPKATTLALATVLALSGSYLTFSATAAPAAPALRIDAGSPKPVADASRAQWAADRGFVGGVVRTSAVPVANTRNDRLYQSARHGMSGYRVALEPGRYQVRLLLAELEATRPGQRVFDVRAEGQLALDDVDALARAGRRTALHQNFTTEVRDGRLDLEFVRVAGSPAMLAGLQITRIGALPTPESELGSDADLAPAPQAPAPQAPAPQAPPAQAPAAPPPAQPNAPGTAPRYEGLPGPASARVLSYTRAASGDWVMDVEAQGQNARFVRYTAWVEDARGNRYGAVTGHWGSSSGPGERYGVIVKAGTFDNRPPAGVQAVRAVVEVIGENPNGVGPAAAAASTY